MSRPRRPRPTGDVEWHFLEARRLMESGKNRAAMEQAGFGIRLDLARPDGYMILGELNLLEGDLLEARRSFGAAAKRSRGETKCAALAGLAQVAWLAGDFAEAGSRYRDALREDPSDPLNLRPALVEVLLRIGDVTGARAELQKCGDESVDLHVLAGLIHWKRGDFRAAVVSLRRALLENVYLPAALAAAEVQDLGLVHGLEEATPEHARALGERVVPLLRSDRGAEVFFSAVADAPAVRREREQLVGLAQGLQAEPDPARRRELLRAIEALRAPAGIASTAEEVLSEIRRAQPGLMPRGSFEV